MKKLYSAFVCILLACTSRAQQPWWQQHLKYRLDVHLNDKTNTLDGFARIEYTNHSPDSLHIIWMHLWANAFRNDRTAYSDQALQNGDTRFYFSAPEQRGYINQLDFRINEQHIPVEDHEEHQDIVKLLLPQPIAPGETLLITTPFHVQLPFNFGEGGHRDQSYEVIQWYPQPAVYDSRGWHLMPWLAQGRPYTNPASFDVSISLPVNYVVVAPGDLQNNEEKQWLQQRSSFNWTPTKQRIRQKNGQYRTIRHLQPPSDTAFKTLRFSLEQGYGFSWLADKRLVVAQDTLSTASGDKIGLHYYYLPGDKPAQLMEKTRDAFRYYDSSIAGYPYQDLHIVRLDGNKTYAGAIRVKHERDVPEILSRMWFEQLAPGNPRQHPWMSNGPASWYAAAYHRERNGETIKEKIERAALSTMMATRNDQPIDLPAQDYQAINYQLSTRTRAAGWLTLLGKQTSEAQLKEILSAYSRQWRFRSAYPETLQHMADSISGQSTEGIFRLLSATGPLTPVPKKKLRVVIGGKPDLTESYHTIGVGPALGYNRYDGLMAGLVVHNYQLPPTPLKFVLAPMFGIRSKTIDGIGRVSYTGYPQNFLHSWEAGLDLAKFTYNEFTDTDDHTTRLGFVKIAPWVQLNLKERDARSTRETYLRLKYYLLPEENFRFQYDSAEQKMHVDAVGATRSFGQIKLVSANHRALYPYKGELQFEGARDFGRLTFTGNYFFNYPKAGGLDIRAFAGKFFYFGDRNYGVSRYHLNMTGPNGREDYAYANYFFGRSEFRGWMSQQIMMRDGGFKVRTDLLGNKIGRTDNWLVALNLNSTLHPKLPVKLFADLGTYGDAWAMESDQPRLLFDAGLQLSLLKNTVNVYVPLLYSNVYRDYFKMYTNFWQRISFSLDIPSFSFKQMLSRFPHHER